jgi:hypothetical protein
VSNDDYNTLLLMKDSHWFFEGSDGQLGNRWFDGRIWKFDYLNKSLSVLTQEEATNYVRRHNAQAIPITFKADGETDKAHRFPRMFIEVDHQQLPMLLDTGATTFETRKNNAGESEDITLVGTSFISESIFRQWQKNHPDWQIKFEHYQGMKQEMIEVPSVTLAGFKTGPVWFTLRPDTNFHDYMSSMMSDHVEGAIGGSAFQYFSMIINYPASEVIFWRPTR